MGSVEERLAAVEARAGEQSVMMEAIRQSLDRLDQRLTSMEGRIDQRFTAIDQRFTAIDQRFIGIDERLATIDRNFAAVRAEMSAHFRWLAGIQITVFVGITAAMISGFLALR